MVLAMAGRLSLPQAAVAYAASSLAVFPCARGAKRPLIRHGFNEATTDLEQIEWWWRRWPDANIGLPTGQPGGFDVVDVDVRPAGSGFAALRQARQAGLLEGWAALVSSPSGGVHLYFPAGGGQRSWVLPRAHVDFRGLGGYVICPPSRLRTADGLWRSYRLIAIGEDPRRLDSVALRARLAPAQPPPPRRRVGPELDEAGGMGERLAAWLGRQPEGNRNRALFWSACRQAEAGVPEGVARELLGAAAERIGLGEREIETTIASAFRVAGCRPVQSPDRGRGLGR